MTGRRALEPLCGSPALELSLGGQGSKVRGHDPSLAGDLSSCQIVIVGCCSVWGFSFRPPPGAFFKSLGVHGGPFGAPNLVTFAACERSPSLEVGLRCSQE